MSKDQPQGIDRRTFLKGASVAGAALTTAPYFVPSTAFGANDKITMAIIGSGGRGRGVMSDLIRGGAEFTGVCDVYKPNLDRGVRDLRKDRSANPTEYLDYEELLDAEKGKVDAILIATPEHQHCTQLIKAVRAGYDVYCEKPMSHSIEEGAKTVKEINKHDRIVQIGMQRRSSPMVRKGKGIIDQGMLGQIHHVRAKWNWHSSRVLDDSELPGELDVEKFIGPAKGRIDFTPMMFREWRYFWKFSGGNITDQGTHLMDVVQWYLGEEMDPVMPVAAECFGGVYEMKGSETPDIFTSIYEYPNFLAEWTLDYCSSYQNSWSLEFMGTDAAMVLDDHGWRVYKEPWKTAKDKPWNSGADPIAMERGGIPTRPHTDNFLQAVRTREMPNAPVEIGHKAVTAPHLGNVAFHKARRAYLGKGGDKTSTRRRKATA